MRWSGQSDKGLWPRVIGDIGGTNARFAYLASPTAALSHHRVLPCADFPGIEQAIRHYLEVEGVASPQAVCFGIANPVISDQVRMTNHAWAFSIDGLRKALNLNLLMVMNDFTALAMSITDIPHKDLLQLGGGPGDAQAAMGIIGPGTGLGISGLIPSIGGGWAVIAGEGGHVTLAAQNSEEHQVLEVLRRRYGHVSAERVLSGPGLVDLYHALLELKDTARELTSPAEVLARAAEFPQSSAQEALHLFARWLASTAADLALTLGARRGIYIGGGIAPRIAPLLQEPMFRDAFESKGRFKDYLKDIPVYLICSAQSPALTGAAKALSTLCHDN